MELLIVKAGNQYFRFSEGECLPCGLAKASVYPISQADEVNLLCAQLRAAGVAANLMKLIIVEEPYTE